MELLLECFDLQVAHLELALALVKLADPLHLLLLSLQNCRVFRLFFFKVIYSLLHLRENRVLTNGCLKASRVLIELLLV